MSPDDPRHGTYAGTAAHWKAREKPCEPCRIAGLRTRKWNRYRQLTGQAATVSALGTVRRIQALQCLGWTHQEIADTAGVSIKAMRSPLVRGTSVYRALADAVASAYDQLAMKPAPDSRNSRYCRTTAQRRGWAPPLAWDDIDDPDATPDFGAPDIRPANGGNPVHYLLEDAEWLAEDDRNLTYVLERLGVNGNTFRDACRREGRMDLYWRLANREPDAEQRRATRDGIKRRKEVA